MRTANGPEHPGQDILAEGIKVPLSKFCVWFGVPRRTVYYRPTEGRPTLRKADQSHDRAETVLRLQDRGLRLGLNKNRVQRVFQLRGWQVRKRPVGMHRQRLDSIPHAIGN